MGDYVHLFADETERTQYERSAQYNEPYISATDDTFDAEYNKLQKHKYGVKYTDTETNMHDFTFVEYDAEIEYLGMNLVSQKQYINLASIPGFNYSEISSTDIIKLKLKSIFPKPQNDRNFIASLGLHNYFHYTEINNSKIGGYAYKKVVGLFDYDENKPIEIDMQVSNNSFYVEFKQGEQINSLSYPEAAKTIVPVTIGALLSDNATSYISAKQKLISAKIEVNGTTTFDAIPVRIGNTGYMYDKVSCQLLGNSGSGNFVLGPDKYDAQIEYLQSSYNQVIETGVIPDINFGYDCYISMIPDSNTNYGYKYIGYASMANWANNMAGFGYAANGNNKITFYWKSTYKSALNVNSSKIHIIWKNGTCNISDASGQSTSFTYDKTSTISSGVGFQIFNVGINWFESIKNTYGGKLYSFKLYSSNELTRDFIPVRVGNIGYLYDKVYGKLYGNAGLGQFVLGPDVV